MTKETKKTTKKTTKKVAKKVTRVKDETVIHEGEDKIKITYSDKSVEYITL